MRGLPTLAGVVLAVVALSLPVTALAEGMTTSLRPRPRPVTATETANTTAGLPAVTTVTTENAPQTVLRPKPRPAGLSVVAPATVASGETAPSNMLRPRARPAELAGAFAAQAGAATAPDAVFAAGPDTLRPKPRPADLDVTVETASAAAAPAQPEPEPQAQTGKGGFLGALFGNKNAAKPRRSSPSAGSVCGDPAIEGEDVATITSKVKGCGVEEPVRVTAIDGIRLNMPATINCTTARALKTWIDNGLRPNVKGEVVELRIAASYICRPRNNVKGNKISEHGRGNAVDVAGVVFSDGRLLTVSGDFSKLRKAYRSACGTFGTTLGPGSDGYHEDHMHFDTASYRSGAYCR